MASVQPKSARHDGRWTPSKIISVSRSVSVTDHEMSSLGEIISVNSDATSVYHNSMLSKVRGRAKFSSRAMSQPFVKDSAIEE